MVEGKLYNKNINFLIDTGSKISLIRTNIIEQLQLEQYCYKIPSISLIGANNKLLYQVNKGIIGKVFFKNIGYKMQFLLVKNLSYDAILGTDELDRKGIIIDYNNGNIQIAEELIPFIKINDKLETDQNKLSDIKTIMNIQTNENVNDIICSHDKRKLVISLLKKFKNLINNENRIGKEYVHKIEVKGIENFR